MAETKPVAPAKEPEVPKEVWVRNDGDKRIHVTHLDVVLEPNGEARKMPFEDAQRLELITGETLSFFAKKPEEPKAKLPKLDVKD